MTTLALVVLDTLRKDAFDRHFEWLPGRRFERAYTTANWTVPAHASLFTGRYGSEVGAHAKHLQFDCEQPSLAEQLRAAGYATHAFSANANLTPHFGFDRGFEDFHIPSWFETPDDDLFDWREFSRTTPYTGVQKYLRGVYECLTAECRTVHSLLVGARLQLARGNEFAYGGTEEATDVVRATDYDDPSFLFLNVMETHEPYVAPSSYRTVEPPAGTNAVGDILLGSVDPTQVRQAYDDCARYLSDVYRRLFEDLSASFDYVITLSDHGEMLGEHGAWGHEHGVHPELTNVPLVISGDDLSGTCEVPVSLLDVHATVLSLAGIETDPPNQVLTGEVTAGEYLTEYHGLTTWSERTLAHEGYGDLIDQYNEPLYGYVAPPDYYGYQTVAGFVEDGESEPDDPRTRMEVRLNDRDVRVVSGDTEVPDAIREQLEYLGYA